MHDVARTGSRTPRRRWTWLALVVALAVAARLPFLRSPLGADEGGFLLVASQWAPGPSLYGHYWVDRPPLLIDVFVVAHLLGGLPGVRLIGIAVVVASVLLAARIGRLVGGSALACAVTAAVFLTTPLFGALELNGEQVAMPCVLGGVVAALEAARSPARPRRTALLVVTGGLGAAAVLVKQNEIDVAVLAAVAALTFLRHDGDGRPVPLWRTWLPVGAGALVVTAAVLGQAALRGTDPGPLWDAVVTFRLDAARVIRDSAPSTTTGRLRGVLLALLLSGAPLLLAGLARRLRPSGRPGGTAGPDLRWAVLALLAWESTSVVAGGSYWLHYLICLVPGLVVTTGLVSADPTPAWRPLARRTSAVGAALAVATASCAVAWTVVLADPAIADRERSPVVPWLREHQRPGDTAVVAFGRPDYLTETGMHSPYDELWSLPVRVRDPELADLSRVLASPRRPTWIVTDGEGTLQGWGIDDARAEPLFERHYERVADLGDRQVYLRRSLVRSRLAAAP